MLRVFFTNTVRRPLLLVSNRPFAANGKESTSDEESARPLREKINVSSFMDRFARKIDQTQKVSQRQKQQTFNNFQSENAKQYKMRKQSTALASDDPNNQIFNDMLEGEVNKFYRQSFNKNKQAFMESLLENDSDELFKILLDLKKNVRGNVDSRLDSLDQILAICQQKEEQIKVVLNQLKETGVTRSSEEMTDEQKNKPQISAEEVFIMKFGMKKQSLIDRWIMMEESELKEECEKYEVPYQKGQFLLNVLMNYAETYVNQEQEIKKAEFKKMVKNSILFGVTPTLASSSVSFEAPIEEIDDISKIARKAQDFKASLNEKLQKQEEQERQNFERKQKQNTWTPGPVRELVRFAFPPQADKSDVPLNFYSGIPTLKFSLTRLQMDQQMTQATQVDKAKKEKDIQFNPADYDPKEILRKHIKESKGFNFKQLCQTLEYARKNEEQLELHPDLKREFSVFLKNFDNQFNHLQLLKTDNPKPEVLKPDEKALYTFQIPKARSSQRVSSLLEDLLYFALKPEFAAMCPSIKTELECFKLLKVPPVQLQTLSDLKSLASILGQLVNLPVKRNKLGQVVDDSDLDKFQNVVKDVQAQFSCAMMPFSHQIDEIPITLRANMLLLFPSLDEIRKPEMIAQLEALISSLTKSAFRSERSQGNTELSNSQVVYLAARVAQFYKVNNDLVTNFRAAILKNLYPGYFTRQQLFMIIKTQACDQSVLSGPKGLNDIQFFTGCQDGCKYDPFLPSNQLPFSEIMKVAKVGIVDQALVNSFYVQAPLTLSVSQTIKDYEANLYMTDYVNYVMPPFIQQCDEYYTRKQIQSILNLNEKYELPINTLLRQTAVTGKVTQRVAWYGAQIARISMVSKSQSLKRDADRELLQRFCDALTYKIIMTSRIYEHTATTQQSSKKYFKQWIVCDETLITFNQLTKDLLAGDDYPVEVTKKDVEIINSYLQYPLVAHRLFNTPEEAKNIIRVYFDRNMQLLEKDRPTTLRTQEQWTESLHQYEKTFLTLKNLHLHCFNDPETEKIRAHIVSENILKFGEQLNKFIASSETQKFPLKQFFEANAALLEAIEGYQASDQATTNQLMQLYIKTIPAAQISSNLLSRHNMGYNIPVQEIPLSPESKELVEKAIVETNWGTIQSMINAMINHFLPLLKFKNQATANARMKQFWGLEDQCSDYLLRLQNIRTLHGSNLAKLIEVISYLPQRRVGEFDQLLVDITPIIGTVQVQLIPTDLTERQKKLKDILTPVNERPEMWLQHYYQEEATPETEDLVPEPFLVPEFDAINQHLLSKHNLFQLKLIKLFCECHKRTLSYERLSQCNLRELSNIFQLQFEKLSIDDQISCLTILGNSFENYNESFAMKLFELFDNEKKLDKLFQEKNAAFFKLAQAWPQFLKNSAITKITTSAKLLDQPLEQQYAALKVLTDKKILHPALINSFFKKIVPLTDRELVKKYISQLVSTMSLLGYTGDVSMQMVTQLLRRLYKDPESIDHKQLLDFLVCFALSNPDLESFEKKNSQFVEQCLDLIEQTYTGARTTTVLRIKPQAESARSKIHEKTVKLAKGHPDVEEFQMYYFPTITKTGGVFKKSMQVVLPIDDLKNLSTPLMLKYRYMFERDLQNQMDEEVEENQNFEKAAQQQTEKEEEKGDETEIKTETESGIKVYDRRASDQGRNDDVMLTKLRDQSWKKLSKKSRYNMIYSSHQESLIDLNDNQTAKAWAVLYHFRGKTTESMLYEEFNAVAQRFANQKANMYDQFGKFYYQLLEHYSNEGISLNLSRSCSQTGWPMDIQLVPNAAYQFKHGQKKTDKQYAIYFLVTQEMCANSKNEFQLEPMGIQKLMQRHFNHYGDFKVIFVTEDDVFANMQKVVDGVKETLKESSQVEASNAFNSSREGQQRQINV